jgi:SAM-dependent methyltransferase
MREQEHWRPSKFVAVNGRYRASRDPNEVAPASRLITDRLATVYEEVLRRHARGALLDLGCGKVPLFGVYRDLVTSVTCVDWAARGDVSHLDHQIDLNEPLPLPDGRFDTILATDVFEHVTRPADLFREISRLLSAGGALIAGVPFIYWIHEEPHDYYRYTEFALKQLSEASGLTVSSVAPYGGAPEIVFDTLAKMVSHGRLGTMAAGRWMTAAITAVGRACVGSAVGRRVSRATARSLPLGYCLIAIKPADAKPASLPRSGLD